MPKIKNSLKNDKSLENILKTKFNKKNFLITYHPETVGIKSSAIWNNRPIFDPIFSKNLIS